MHDRHDVPRRRAGTRRTPHGRALLAVAGLLAGLLTGVPAPPATAQPRSTPSGAPVVRLDTGQVRGTSLPVTGGPRGRDLRAEAFLGVPFAAAPVGPLRWQDPRPAPSWSGVRAAVEPPPVCPQASAGGVQGQEDCLYLTVYRPAGLRARARAAVVVYAYGGGNVSGSANGIDARRMAAEHGVVVVVPNYRLGALGFLDAAGLDAGGGGNFGVRDLEAALRWTQRNAAALGGDPARVTLASQSSGATNTCRLLVDPGARGLFSAATLSSEDCLHDVDTPAQARGRAADLAAAVGCTDPARRAECLRQASPRALVGAGGGWNPVAEVPAVDRIAVGDWNRVPLLVGSTRDEGRSAGTAFTGFSAADYRAWIVRLVGEPAAERVLAEYPADRYSGPYALPYAVGDVITDSGMRGLGGCTDLTLMQRTAWQTPTYGYEFDDPDVPGPDSPAGYDRLASHGSDVAYLFPEGDPAVSGRFNRAQRQLSERMIAAWAGFARDHRPRVAAPGWWPSLDGRLLRLSPRGDRVVDVAGIAEDRHCALWWSLPPVLDRGEV